jgi:uncharacterized pyridoxamine 5'-phosphate oxidase family protein
MIEVKDFIKDCGVYYLATDDNGQPRVRPFGTVEIFEGKLYIQTGKNKDVYSQIMNNNKVELCALKEDKWLRLSGELVTDDRVEAKKHMLDNYKELRNMYDENDDNTAVLYFKNAKAVISSFSEEPKVIEWS